MELTTLSVLLFLSITIILIGNRIEKDLKYVFYATGTIGLTLVLIIATVFNKYIKIEEVRPIEVVKSKSTVYVEIENKTLSFKEKSFYDKITDTTIFYKITFYNYYGLEKGVEYTINETYKNIEKGKIIEIKK